MKTKTEERQKQIINEAIMLIHNSGYEALTIKNLSKKVKISEPAIYRHFKNKEQIILGVLDKMNEFENALVGHIGLINNHTEKLKEMIIFHFKYFEDNKEMTSIIFSEDIFRNGKKTMKRLIGIISKRRQLFCKTLREARKNNVLKDLDTCGLATIILGFIRILVLEWRLSGYAYSIFTKGNEETKELLKLILKTKYKQLLN